MKFNENDTIEITIEGTGPGTYLHCGDEATLTADVTSIPDGGDVAAYVELHDELGGLDEGRIDVDEIPGEDEMWNALTMFDSEGGDGPHWAGVIVAVDFVA